MAVFWISGSSKRTKWCSNESWKNFHIFRYLYRKRFKKWIHYRATGTRIYRSFYYETTIDKICKNP